MPTLNFDKTVHSSILEFYMKLGNTVKLGDKECLDSERPGNSDQFEGLHCK